MEPQISVTPSSTKEDSRNVPSDNDQPNLPAARDLHGIRWILFVVSLISTTFLWGLDGTITADIQATFVLEFHSIEKLAYNSVAFFLGAAATVLTWGQVYGQFDAKWVFIVCVVAFEAGSALCGAAPNIATLIAGRTVCGIGGSGMYSGVLTLLSLTTTTQERALYMGIPGLTWGAGTVLGPVIGGAFAVSRATWRFGFYINLFIGAIFAPVYFLLIPSRDPRPGVRFWTRLRSIDWVGFVLLAGTTTALILAMCFGGLTYPWDSAQVITLFVVSGVLLALFLGQQVTGRFTRQEVFPMALMRNRNIFIVFINETCSSTSCFLPCYFIPLYFQYVRNESPLMAGVHLLPFIIFMVSTVILCGSTMRTHNHTLPWFFYGGSLVLVGGALMYTVNEHTSSAKTYGYSILLGSGTGAYIQMPFNAAQAFVSAEQIPAAVGLITWAQLAAPAVTLSVANAVFLNRAVVALGEVLPDDAPVLSIISGVGREYLNNLDKDTRTRAVHAILNSMRNAYVLVVVSGAVTIVLSGFLVDGGRVRRGITGLVK